MKVSELIAQLQALPQDIEVEVDLGEPKCCCGECFCPNNEYRDPYAWVYDGKALV